jgi:hypothetical protein
MEQTDVDPATLQRAAGNSLKENYKLHDYGEARAIKLLEDKGHSVEQWGIDKRHSTDGLIFDDKMDLRVWEAKGTYSVSPTPPPSYTGTFFTTEMYENGHPVNTCQWSLSGLVDVKTKSASSWSSWKGCFNLRHMVHYAAWARHYDVPVFVYFTKVDKENDVVGDEEFVCPITPFEKLDEYIDHYDRDTDKIIDTTTIADDCQYVGRTFGADDGNAVVVIDEEYRCEIECLFKAL